MNTVMETNIAFDEVSEFIHGLVTNSVVPKVLHTLLVNHCIDEYKEDLKYDGRRLIHIEFKLNGMTIELEYSITKLAVIGYKELLKDIMDQYDPYKVDELKVLNSIR